MWTMKRLIGEVGRRGIVDSLKAAGRVLRRRVPVRSDPALYREWIRLREPSGEALDLMRARAATFAYQPLVSVVVPVHNTDSRWLRACVASVKGQIYPHWQLCLADDGSTELGTQEVLRELAGEPRIRSIALRESGGISAALNAALALAEGDFVAFLDHDDELAPDALFEVVDCLNQHPDADLIYSDEDKLDEDGSRCDVFFKPDWSPEHLLSAMYMCHLMVVRRRLIERIGGFRTGYEGAQDHDLVLRAIEHTSRVHHVPKVLYHWRRIPGSTANVATAKPWADDAGKRSLEDYLRRNMMDASVSSGGLPGLYRVRFAVRGTPLVSIVLPSVPNDSGADHVCKRFVRSVLERTAYREVEVLVPVADDRARKVVERRMGGIPWREVRIGGQWTAGRGGVMNQAANQAAGEHLLFMDWGLSSSDADWLSAMLEYSQQTAIGAVGGKIASADGRLQHVGLLVGVGEGVAPALSRQPSSSLGYFSSAISVRNYSAVSAACMMTRHDVFDQVAGFREALVHFGDVDYCLRIGAAGFRVVFTPYASFLRQSAPAQEKSVALGDEEARLVAQWNDRRYRDPYYNVNLSRRSPHYEPEPLPPDAR
jgi:GT2 family glycosyltransferase